MLYSKSDTINKQLNKLSCSVQLIQIKSTATAKRETGVTPVRTRHCKRGVFFLNHPFGVIATEAYALGRLKKDVDS